MAPEHPHCLLSNLQKMSRLSPLLATYVIQLRPVLEEVECSLVDVDSVGGAAMREVAGASSKESVLVEEVSKEDTAMTAVEVVVVVPGDDGLDGRIMTNLKEIVTLPLILRQTGRC
jgi:hypothetical protein